MVKHSSAYLHSHWGLLWRVSRTELSSRYAGSLLGVSWALLGPVFTLAVYSVVYLLILRVSVPGLSAPQYVLQIFAGLVKFMTSSPVLVLAVRGNGAITICRNMMGATFGSKAAPGTIRGDFGVSNSFNLIHGSDSPEAAERELKLFFKAGEVLNFPRAVEGWVYDMSGGKPE